MHGFLGHSFFETWAALGSDLDWLGKVGEGEIIPRVWTRVRVRVEDRVRLRFEIN